LVIEQYENGMTPEDTARAYDSLAPADVYAVIAYDLRHRDEVCGYLERRDQEAYRLRAKIEVGRPSTSRAELLARRDVMEAADAPAGQ
jgi:hypothetical protein